MEKLSYNQRMANQLMQETLHYSEQIERLRVELEEAKSVAENWQALHAEERARRKQWQRTALTSVSFRYKVMSVISIPIVFILGGWLI